MLKSDGDILYCLKTGDVSKVNTIFKKKCNDEDYTSTLTFTYADTIKGLLIFDYKALSDTQNVTLKRIDTGKSLASKMITTTMPKDLKETDAYYNVVLDTLREGITASGFNRGYFMDNRTLNQQEAYLWIKNSLLEMLAKTSDTATRNEISNRISEISEQKSSMFQNITREDFFADVVKYLSFDDS